MFNNNWIWSKEWSATLSQEPWLESLPCPCLIQRGNLHTYFYPAGWMARREVGMITPKTHNASLIAPTR